MTLNDYIKPGYPTEQRDGTGVRKTYVMVGKLTDLTSLMLGVGAMFNGYPIEKTDIQPLSTSGWIEYTVETYYIYVGETNAVVDDQYPFWEIDQVQVEKSLKQHPNFISFSATDWAAVQAWEAEVNQELRSAYQYYKRDADGKKSGTVQTLTGSTASGQTAYAYLRLRGVESFLDFAPVVRRTSKYYGNAAPSSADAGQLTSAPAYAPAGYQWLKTADRVSKQGTRGSEWIKQEEWTGARKVLLDKDSLFTP